MRLIECYIENFGIYHEYGCKFDTGLNCRLSDNGSGKTTLSVFLTAMLYGMPETRRQNLSENERKKHAPWQGGRYGGSLTLEVRGKRYTVERSFGSKPSEDTFVLRDTVRGTVSTDFSERLGEELFGIDRDGFLRTVFLSEKNLSVANDNKSISAKLSDLVGVDGDVGGFDDAIALLDERRKFYYKKSGNCEIANTKATLARKKGELDEITAGKLEREGRLLSLRELAKRQEKIESEKNALSGELLQSNERSIRRLNIERYKELEEKLKRLEGRFSELESFFGGRVPTAGEINEIRFSLIECERIEKEEREAGAPVPDERYSALSFEALAEAERALTRLEDTEDELERIRREKAEKELQKPQKESGRSRGVALIIIGALLTALGITLGASLMTAFYGISALGAALVFGGIFRTVKEKTEEKPAPVPENDESEKLLESRAAELRSMLSALTRELGYEGVDLPSELTKIKAEYTRYYTLRAAKASDVTGREKRLETVGEMRRRAKEFTERYSLECDDPLTRLSELTSEYSYTARELEQARKECIRYKAEHDITPQEDDTPVAPGVDLAAEISAREAALSEMSLERARLTEACERDNADIERAAELDGEIAECEEKLARYIDTLGVIQKTMALLTEACDNMTARYIGKTREGFLKYEEALGGGGGSFAVDTDFTVSKNEHGAARPEESYSRGTRDLYSFAMRLALIDSLYENEIPFIILDDPFISLDDERLKRAKKLISELAKARQVIYFTCSKSRQI